jgi:hypothetical protein
MPTESGSTSSSTNKPAAVNGLEEFERFRNALRETHEQIPNLLKRELDLARELGQSEARGGNSTALLKKIEETRVMRECALLRRKAAASAICGYDGQLRAERVLIERMRRDRVSIVVEDFRRRYNAAVEALQALWCEGDKLREMLQADIPMPIPARVQSNFNGGSTVVAVRGMAKASMDVETMRLTDLLTRIDADLTLISGIRQARDVDARYYQLAVRRREPTEPHGMFRVLERCFCSLDGQWFERDTVIDASLVGGGNLMRLIQSVRLVRPVEFEVPSSTAA